MWKKIFHFGYLYRYRREALPFHARMGKNMYEKRCMTKRCMKKICMTKICMKKNMYEKNMYPETFFY